MTLQTRRRTTKGLVYLMDMPMICQSTADAYGGSSVIICSMRCSIAILTVKSPIVSNVPTRDLLAVEAKDSFLLWLAKFKKQKLWFINSEVSIKHHVFGVDFYIPDQNGGRQKNHYYSD